MYFLPRNNAVYAFLVSIPPAYRYIITIACILCISYAWFIGPYTYLETVKLSYDAQMLCMEHERMSYERSPHIQKKLSQSITHLEQDIADFKDSANSDPSDVHTMLMQLLGTTEQYGLTFNSCDLDKQINCDWYFNNKVNVSVNGTLEQIILFLSALTNQSRLIVCEHLSLHALEKDLFKACCVINLCTVK